MTAKFEPITGRYMHLELFGRHHRIYVEEAGGGTPLLCLHTAGSDGRQYRALMTTTASSPRHAMARKRRRGGLAQRRIPADLGNTTMILEIMAALELDRPIAIGCSIGYRIALHRRCTPTAPSLACRPAPMSSLLRPEFPAPA
jgi:pimeloyl-ACP methyl ester carboxylesterase